jgi:RNA polymerase sigma factor (sigma-70 family)
MPKDRTGPDNRLDTVIASYLAGETAAADRLCEALAGPIRLALLPYMDSESPDLEDITQDTLLAVLHYLRDKGGFTGNLVKFAVTVARNRYRNLLNWRRRHPTVDLDPLSEWLARPESSPLDLLLEAEVRQLLQQGLDTLETDCQDILRSFYLNQLPIESLRRRIGLKTVQGIYYRKSLCLEKLARFLKKRLAVCSVGGMRKKG